MTNPIQDEWQSDDGSARLLLGDCLQVLPTLSGIDCIVTDPPYGTEREGIHNNARWNNSGGKKSWVSKTWNAISGDKQPFNPEHLMIAGQLCFWGANWYWDKLPHRRGMLIWDKTGGGKARAEFKNDCEIAWTTETDAVRVFHHMWNGYKRDSEIGNHVHPTQKPVALMKWCLGFVSGRTVADPYMGSGTTGVACIRTERRFIGIEIERKYFDIAVERCKRELERFPLFEKAKPEQQVLVF